MSSAVIILDDDNRVTAPGHPGNQPLPALPQLTEIRGSPDIFDGDDDSDNESTASTVLGVQSGEPIEIDDDGSDHPSRPTSPVPPNGSPDELQAQAPDSADNAPDDPSLATTGSAPQEGPPAQGPQSDTHQQPVTVQPTSAPANTSLNSSILQFQSPKKIKPKSPEKDEEEGECCPICFESWTNSGIHRLVSLKCGHLFGQSCIEKWLKGQGGKCPQCNAKAQRKDIRVIYAKALKSIDTTERDRALQDLEKEKEARRKAEVEAAQARLRYQMAIDECNKLKQEIERQRQQLQNIRSVGSAAAFTGPTATQQSQSGNKTVYTAHTNIKIFETGGCRVMAYCPRLAILLVSQPSASPLFPGFGVKKVSALDFKTAQYVSVHSKVIRDMAVNPHGSEGMTLLTCGIDKTIKITNLLSNNVVQSYQASLPVWSCTWSGDDRYCFYAGQQNGTVLMFDIRNTGEHIMELNKEGSRSPVVSLQYVPNNPDSLFRSGGLIVGQLDRTSFYEKKSGEEFKIHALPLEGSLISLSLEPATRHFLATFRPTTKHPSVRHQMCELSCTNLSVDPTVIDNSCTCHNVHTFHGGSTQKLLSRSRLFSGPGTDSNLLACTGDEASQSVQVWDASNGHLKQKLPMPGPVVDLCPFTHNDCNYLACLTDKMVRVHKWL